MLEPYQPAPVPYRVSPEVRSFLDDEFARISRPLNDAASRTEDFDFEGVVGFENQVSLPSVLFSESTNNGVYISSPNLGNLEVGTEHGWVRMGPLNSGFAHMETNATNGFYFYQIINTAGTKVYKTAGVSNLSRDFLHIDGKEAIDGNDVFLRLNQNNDFTGGVYSPGQIRTDNSLIIGATGNGLRSVTGTYGSVQTVGAGTNGHTGYSCNGLAVFMADSSGNAGLYNDQDNEWWLYGQRNGVVMLYHNGTERLRIESYGAGALGGGEFRGYNVANTSYTYLDWDETRDAARWGTTDGGSVRQYALSMTDDSSQSFYCASFSKIHIFTNFNETAAAEYFLAGANPAVKVYEGSRVSSSNTSNPDVDGDLNIWWTGNGFINIKNRLGSTRSVYLLVHSNL